MRKGFNNHNRSKVMKMFNDLPVGCKYTKLDGGVIFMKTEVMVGTRSESCPHTPVVNAVVIEQGSSHSKPGTLLYELPNFDVIPLG